MKYKNYNDLDTREYLQCLFNGEIPVRGENHISYIRPDDENGFSMIEVPDSRSDVTYFDDENAYAPRPVYSHNVYDWYANKARDMYAKQAEIAKRNREYAEKYSENPLRIGLRNMDGEDWKDVGMKSLLGAEHVLDGATYGIYGKLSDRYGGNYTQRREDMQKLADEAGVGRLNEYTEKGLNYMAKKKVGKSLTKKICDWLK